MELTVALEENVDKTAAGGGMISIYFLRDIKEMWENVAIKCREEAGQVLLKKGECAGIPQYEVLRTVLRTVSFTSLVCTAVRMQRQ